MIYELIDYIDFIWCNRHRFTRSVIKKIVLTREIIIIATSNFLGNFLWTIFLKLFLQEWIYEFIDSIDFIWCNRHRFTRSVIKKLLFTREIIIIAIMNHFSKTISSWIVLWIYIFNWLKMVYYTSIYTFCYKKICFNKSNYHYSNFKLPGKFSMNHFSKTISSWIDLWIDWLYWLHLV